MDQATRQKLIEELLRQAPEKSNRQVASSLGVSHHTVAASRKDLQATGQIAQLDKTVGKDGKARKQPAKAAPKPTKAVQTGLLDLAVPKPASPAEEPPAHLSTLTDSPRLVSRGGTTYEQQVASIGRITPATGAETRSGANPSELKAVSSG